MKVPSLCVTSFLIFGMKITIVICWFVFTSSGLSMSILWDFGQSSPAQYFVDSPCIPGTMTVILGQPRRCLRLTRYSTMSFLHVH